MGFSTTYLDQKVVDHLNGVTTFAVPSTLWVALTTVVLTRTNTTMPATVEMVGSGYARTLIKNDATFWGPAIYDSVSATWTATNDAQVVFPNVSGADYPAIPGWAFLDDPLGGNILWAGAFANQAGFAVVGQTPLVDVGAFTISATAA